MRRRTETVIIESQKGTLGRADVLKKQSGAYGARTRNLRRDRAAL